jgi:hypothetical protein
MSKNDENIEIIKSLSIGDISIDATNPDNLSNKVLPEQETRRRLLSHARLVGCEKDMLLLFKKYDNLLRNCTNEKERSDIGKLGAYETYRLLGGGGELYVDGQLVCKDR